MTIPNLPTDNLYKFVALSGVVIVILSVYFAETKTGAVQNRIIDVEQEQQLLIHELETLKERAKELDELLDNSSVRLRREYGSESDKLEVKSSNSELTELHVELGEAFVEQGRAAIRLQNSTDRLGLFHKRSKQIVHWGFFFIAIGLVMANVGFLLWYRRVQKPLDALLQQQLRNTHDENKRDETLASPRN